MMETLTQIKNLLWGLPLLSLLLGTGLFLTFLLKGVQFRYLWYAIKETFSKAPHGSEGDISHFEALMTSLAGAIGTGNIVGVATALTIGGYGSLFWMWVMALLSMATKYAESLLAVKYREVDDKGEMIGGPMHFMKHGLGWKGIAAIFAFIGAIAAFGTGNLVQVNAIVESVNYMTHLDAIWIGIFVAILTALVILGGVKSIGQVAGVLVPFMALFYLCGGLIIIAAHYDQVPHAFYLIFVNAFKGQAAVGGFAGASVMMAIQLGVARSVFSNEAGLGIPSIAAAAAKTDSPGRQALITMTGALLSTLVVCTITGLVLAVTDVIGQVDESGQIIKGATLAIYAFKSTFPWGEYIVTVGLILFAFSTVIAWAYYGEKCYEYLCGTRTVIFYRLFFTGVVLLGAILELDMVWLLADIMNAVLAIPNLIAILFLSKVIVSETNHFLSLNEKESLSANSASLVKEN